jgi:hypothetical protein
MAPFNKAVRKKHWFKKRRLRLRQRQPFRFAPLTTIKLKSGGRRPDKQTIPMPTLNSEFCILNPLIGDPSHARQRGPGTAVEEEVRPGKSTGLFSWSDILIAFTDEFPYPLLFAFLCAFAPLRESQIRGPLRVWSK